VPLETLGERWCCQGVVFAAGGAGQRGALVHVCAKLDLTPLQRCPPLTRHWLTRTRTVRVRTMQGNSATTKMARSFLVRGDWVMKRPTLKRDPQTGMEIDNKVKWDKRYVVLSDTKPPAIYWYKNDAVSASCAAATAALKPSRLAPMNTLLQ
jgi:hypothetical protein